jgi:hypothetical protein
VASFLVGHCPECDNGSFPDSNRIPHVILVTGGAGFIGANFVLDWLRQSDEPWLTSTS